MELKTNSMLLSIVIPTYNRAHLIENTLKSVLNQSENDYEVLIIDDGSTDDTETVVKPYLGERVRYFKIKNSERGAARNYGTKQAKGRYVNWFDSDDEMLPHHVETIKRIMDEQGEVEVLNVLYQMKDSKTQKITSIQKEYLPSQIKRKHYLIEGNYLACNPVVVRRDIALENPFIEDRDLSASEDYELWLRLVSKYPFYQNHVVTSYLIQHDDRSVNTMIDAQKLETRFLTFLRYMSENESFKNYLKDDYSYFEMRNYLVLAVDLAFNKHKKKGFHYLLKAFKTHPSALGQKIFWATIKHMIF